MSQEEWFVGHKFAEGECAGSEHHFLISSRCRKSNNLALQAIPQLILCYV